MTPRAAQPGAINSTLCAVSTISSIASVPPIAFSVGPTIVAAGLGPAPRSRPPHVDRPTGGP